MRGGTKPAAWIAISIHAVGSVTPDADGHMAHVMISLNTPLGQRCGKNLRTLGAWQPDGIAVQDPIEVEFDEGTVWVGNKASLWMLGGTPGDQYDVVINANVPRDECDPRRVIDIFENPLDFRLTTYIVATPGTPTNFPPTGKYPRYHQWFYVVQGSASINTPAGSLPLTNYGPDAQVPLSCSPITVGTGIYVTSGAT